MHEFRGDDHPLEALDVLINAGCGRGFIQRMAARGVQVVARRIRSKEVLI